MTERAGAAGGGSMPLSAAGAEAGAALALSVATGGASAQARDAASTTSSMHNAERAPLDAALVIHAGVMVLFRAMLAITHVGPRCSYAAVAARRA